MTTPTKGQAWPYLVFSAGHSLQVEASLDLTGDNLSSDGGSIAGGLVPLTSAGARVLVKQGQVAYVISDEDHDALKAGKHWRSRGARAAGHGQPRG